MNPFTSSDIEPGSPAKTDQPVVFKICEYEDATTPADDLHSTIRRKADTPEGNVQSYPPVLELKLFVTHPDAEV